METGKRYKINEVFSALEVGMRVSTNGCSTHHEFEGVIGEKTERNFYVWQNKESGQVGIRNPESWVIGKENTAEITLLGKVTLREKGVSVSRAKADAKIEKVEGARKVIKVTTAIHTALNREAQEHSSYPAVFLLGSRGGIVVAMEKLNRDPDMDSCYNMAGINEETLAHATIKLIKKRLLPCGIARAGCGINHDEDEDSCRGHSLYYIRKMSGGKAFCLTVSEERIIVDVEGRGGKYIQYAYAVVKAPKKRKGVKKNGTDHRKVSEVGRPENTAGKGGDSPGGFSG